MSSRLVNIKQRRRPVKKEVPVAVPLMGQVCTNCKGSGVCNDGTNPEPKIRMPTPEVVNLVTATKAAEVVDPLAIPELVRIPEESLVELSTITVETKPDIVVESKLEPPAEVTVENLQVRLNAANQELVRLKKVFAGQTGKNIVISFPLPSVTGWALIDASKYEEAKTIFTGLILELINTTHAGLEAQNRKAYGFYDINPESREVTMTFAETKDL